MDDLIFKALADPSRRQLLDLLHQRDGQSQSELEAHLPMTRFGVAKHLKILIEAGLITTQKAGREKHHFINPVPIQEVYDRWVNKFARPFTSHMTALKYHLEQSMDDTITHRYQIFIQATQEKVWQALTDGTISPQYYFGTVVASTWQDGAEYTYKYPDGTSMIEGEVLESEPPSKLVQTFRPIWDIDAKNLGQSKVTWLIEAVGSGSKLTLIHEELKDTPYANGIIEGWSRILSGMKTLLETGEPLAL